MRGKPLAQSEALRAEGAIPGSDGGRRRASPFVSTPSTCFSAASQVFECQGRVLQNAFQDLGMKNLRRVDGHGHAPASGVLLDLVTAALSRQRESFLFQNRDNFTRCEAGESWHQTATSTVERLTETGSGTSSPSARRSSM
jgi:hypothetical protein